MHVLTHGRSIVRRARALAVLGLAVAVAMVALVATQALNPSPALAVPPPPSGPAKFYLDCPTTSVEEGGSVDVFLVRVADHLSRFYAHWHADDGTATTADYVDQDTGSVWSTDAERLAKRAKRTFHTREDAVVEGDETFTVRFSPTNNVLDIDDSSYDHKCEITITDNDSVDDPRITSFSVASTPGQGDTYGVGESIRFKAVFDKAVVVSTANRPAVGFWIGSSWRAASYDGGSGSNTLTFSYTVQSGDSDSDGVSADGGWIDSSGAHHNLIKSASIRAANNTDTRAYPLYTGLSNQSGHKVDGSQTPIGISSTISSSPVIGDTYRFGETIDFQITFSAAVEVFGTKWVSLRVGSSGSDGWRAARHTSGSGTNTLTFSYTVSAGDVDNDGVLMLGSWIDAGPEGFGGDGTIKVKGTDIVVPPNFSSISDASAHKINAAPLAVGFAITSKPVADWDTYGAGEVMQLSVIFDQNVTAQASAFTVFRVGGHSVHRNATYASGNGTPKLVFEYTVQASDRDHDGVAAFLPAGQPIVATGKTLSYLPSRDGTDLELAADPNHKVNVGAADATAPTISEIHIGSWAGSDQTYHRGDEIQVWVNFSEEVIVTGAPHLALNIGGTSRAATFDREQTLWSNETDEVGEHTPFDPLVFTYIVQTGDVDADGLSIDANSFSLNGGTIQDASKNSAVLTHSAVDHNSNAKVSAPNTAPHVLGPVARSVAENTDSDTNIGDPVTATDPDLDQTLTYSLIGTDAASFRIDRESGQIKTVSALDYETKNSYVMEVAVTDGIDEARVNVTINVTNLDEGGSISLVQDPDDSGTFKAILFDPDGAASNVTWTWERSATASGDWVTVVGATTPTYNVTSEDVGMFLRVTASYTDPEGSGKSAQAISDVITAGGLGWQGEGPTPPVDS